MYMAQLHHTPKVYKHQIHTHNEQHKTMHKQDRIINIIELQEGC